ncbi:MAG: thiamine diphosphokinase, partial [Halanaerobiaceae bacterium]
GIRVEAFPAEKDETDAELALDYCLKEGIKNIIIVGSMGGRFDQQLANVFLLEYAYRRGLKTVIREPGKQIGIIDKEIVFKNNEKDRLSLIPISEKVTGVTIKGCKYGLSDEELYRYRTRGISNVISGKEAVVKVQKGIILYIKDES